MTERITKQIKDGLFIITLNIPKKGNALSFDDYQRLWDLVEIAAKDDSTYATIVQSSGKIFSAGADISRDQQPPEDANTYERQRAFYASQAGMRNLHIPESHWNHPKPLVYALNGPCVGLSGSLAATADFVYALDSAYILIPFSNLGLCTEGGAAYTVVERLGWSIANEALLGAKKISAARLFQSGFLNELWPANEYTTEQFNLKVQQEVKSMLENLDQQSVRNIKKLIKLTQSRSFAETNSAEAILISNELASGRPIERFLQARSKMGGKSKL